MVNRRPGLGVSNTTGIVAAALVVSSVVLTGFRIATTGLEEEDSLDHAVRQSGSVPGGSSSECDATEERRGEIEQAEKERRRKLAKKPKAASNTKPDHVERRYSAGEVTPGFLAQQVTTPTRQLQKGVRDRQRSLSFDTHSHSPSRGTISPMEINDSMTATAGMERVTGLLQKQGDVFGLWRQRYFELTAYDSFELEPFKRMDRQLLAGSQDEDDTAQAKREYFLLYWSCDAKEAQSERSQYHPRGAFMLRNVRIEHESPLVIVLYDLVNAFNLSQKVPPIKICAAKPRSLQKWASAFTFASVASRLPPASFEGCRPFPLPHKSGVVGRCGSAEGDASLNCYVRVYRTADDRVFFMSWENEQAADARSMRPKNVYDISDAKVAIHCSQPTVLSLENVSDSCFASSQRVTGPRGGKVFLKLQKRQDAIEWAEAMIPNECKREIEPLPVAFDNGEDIVDEYIPPGSAPSSAASSPVNPTYSFQGMHGEQFVDEYIVDQLDEIAISNLSVSSVEDADAASDASDSFLSSSSSPNNAPPPSSSSSNIYTTSPVCQGLPTIFDEGEEEDDDDDDERVEEYDDENDENQGASVGNQMAVAEGNSYKAHLAKRGIKVPESLDTNAKVSGPRFAQLSPVHEEGDETGRASLESIDFME